TEGLPVEALGARHTAAHDDLAVEHDAAGQVLATGGDELGEVAGQGLLAPAGELDVVSVLDDDAPEAVPLRLVGPPALDGVRLRDVLDGLGEHRVTAGLWKRCHSSHSARAAG